MKRIMNDVAVQTLLYTTPKQQQIKIVDLEVHPAYDDTKKETVYEGENDLNSWNWSKILKSKIVGWYTETCRVGESEGTRLVIEICTKQDTY